jgi:ferritin-like metal-binding protein YciE
MHNLKHLLVHEIQDLYSAEKQLAEVLPTLVDKAHDPELKSAFQLHLGEAAQQVRRLERVAEILDVAPDEVTCKGMRGLIKEAGDVIGAEQPEVVDAGLIGAAQKVEHYEIAGYGTARAHAQRLGLLEVARLLQQTLDEKAAANDTLTLIAESGVNQLAVEAAAAG